LAGPIKLGSPNTTPRHLAARRGVTVVQTATLPEHPPYLNGPDQHICGTARPNIPVDHCRSRAQQTTLMCGMCWLVCGVSKKKVVIGPRLIQMLPNYLDPTLGSRFQSVGNRSEVRGVLRSYLVSLIVGWMRDNTERATFGNQKTPRPPRPDHQILNSPPMLPRFRYLAKLPTYST
jgi:hypothetical protein